MYWKALQKRRGQNIWAQTEKKDVGWKTKLLRRFVNRSSENILRMTK
jgi:hypothetical protein